MKKRRNSIAIKFNMLAITSLFIMALVLSLLHYKEQREITSFLSSDIIQGQNITWQSVLGKYSQVIDKQLTNTVNTDELVGLLNNNDNNSARQIMSGLFFSLEAKKFCRLTVYDKNLKVILQEKSKNLPLRADSLPEYLHLTYGTAAKDYKYHLFFRGNEGILDDFLVEYCGLTAVYDYDDNIIGFLELAFNVQNIIQDTAALYQCQVGVFNTTTRIFSYSTRNEFYKMVNPDKKDDTSTMLSKFEDRWYQSFILPLEDSAEKTVAELWLTKDRTAKTMTERRNRIFSVFIAFIIIALSLLAVVWSVKTITKPLQNAVRVVDKIGKGDISEQLPMGKAVNCSEVKKCGNTACPSYGKVDHCWSTSGSYALVKHCPRAQKGEDCRSCDMYGAHSEIDELGSIINALAVGLGDRAELALSIAQGDLRQEIELSSEQDKLGIALQTMVQSLNEIISQIQAASDQITAGSGQISDYSQALSQGATKSAAALEQITSSMTEMGSQTTNNAENASQASQLASKAMSVAQAGNGQMQNMVMAMGEINDAGQNISKIIKVIDEIAFQTNLLALNAAVEAARAGRHGKGFAVVAEEVRNLAARSAKAAKETAELIEGSVEKTNKGTEIANKTAESLSEIVTAVTRVTDLVGEISAASNEQAEGISQVNSGLGQIDQVTQQNTASAEEGVTAAEELSSQATHLKGLTSTFTVKSAKEIDSTPQPALPGPTTGTA